MNLDLSISSIYLNPGPFEGPDNEVLILGFLDVAIAVGVAEFHPHVDVFLRRVIPFPTQSAVSFVQERGHFVSGDGVCLSIGIFGEETASDVEIVLGDGSVLAFRFTDYWRLVELLAC